ncbi:trafficking protein particle complex subunit 1-like [Symsagittifera roscoffensis]|uniref:trafficking protein particle complex subunit 1-like n=1 Tax=Symsagittifera roscoffensis TaxID=84072 RepID=UPI00307C2FBA
MPIYNLYIFNLSCGKCVYYCEFNRRHKTQDFKENNDQVNMLGMCHTLKDFMQRVATSDSNSSSNNNSGSGKDSFVSYKTSKAKVHYYETPSGIAFVLVTDPHVGDIRNILQELHKSVWVEYVAKNPLCDWTQTITSNLFREKVSDFMKALPCYSN